MATTPASGICLCQRGWRLLPRPVRREGEQKQKEGATDAIVRDEGPLRPEKFAGGEEWVMPESFTLEVEDLAQALRAGLHAAGVK
jgi:hypothetical protein